MSKGKNDVVPPIGTAGTSRRQVVAGLGAVSAGGLVLRPGMAAAAGQPPSRVKQWLIKSGSEGAKVPLDYLGLHSDHGVSRKAPAPTYPYDAIRSHDVDNGHDLPATQWADIEKKPGVYDWRMVDKWFETHPKKTRIWVLFGTPRFYQKYPNERFVFPHLPGGGSPPKDPQVAANFIKALLARYPGQIQFVEIWNEPNFGPVPIRRRIAGRRTCLTRPGSPVRQATLRNSRGSSKACCLPRSSSWRPDGLGRRRTIK